MQQHLLPLPQPMLTFDPWVQYYISPLLLLLSPSLSFSFCLAFSISYSLVMCYVYDDYLSLLVFHLGIIDCHFGQEKEDGESQITLICCWLLMNLHFFSFCFSQFSCSCRLFASKKLWFTFKEHFPVPAPLQAFLVTVKGNCVIMLFFYSALFCPLWNFWDSVLLWGKLRSQAMLINTLPSITCNRERISSPTQRRFLMSVVAN